MIKIFINEHPLILSENGEDLLNSKNLRLADDDEKSILSAIETLEFSSRSLTDFGIFIPTSDEKDTFKTFKKNYKEIQAAGGIVLNGLGDILLIKRQGKWDLPKGKKDEEEKLENAAVREVQEECGIKKLQLGDFITKSYHTYILDGVRVLKITHWFRMMADTNEKLKPQAEENITDVRWFGIENLDIDKLDTYNSIRHVLHTSLGK